MSSGARGKRATINVGGTVYETYFETLARYPHTLLGEHTKRSLYYDTLRDQYFFDRNRLAFEAILFYYQSNGKLLRPPELPADIFIRECLFYELDEQMLRNLETKEGVSVLPSSSNGTKLVPQEILSLTFREKGWNFLEYPSTSKAAGLFSIISMLAVVASVAILCLSSVKTIQNKETLNTEKDFFFQAEVALNGYFGIEYLVKLAFALNKFKFIKSPLNVIDLCVVFPYFIILAIDWTEVSNLSFLRVLRTFRVLRLLRFSRQSETLKKVIDILSGCVKDLFLLVFCMLLTSTVSGSLAYYVEASDPSSPFTSIPQSMWWGIQTIVCLGYGDIVPVTVGGKIAGGVVAVFGMLTLTVPLLSLGGKYLSKYNERLSNPSGPDF